MVKKILVLVMALMPTVIALAQPQVSRRNTTTQPKSVATTSTPTSNSTKTQATPKKKTATKVSEPTVDRASIMFPTAVTVPQDVSWRRDIYRALDLTQDANAPLYFPVDPQGDRVNLFTLLFQLLNEGKIPAYKYSLDGLENFNKENRMHFKEFLDDNGIDYEIQGNSIKVEPADIPSALVTRFNIKESTYYDQNTATFHSRVIAICPVIQKADDFDFGDDSAFDMSDEETSEEGGMDEAVANEPLPKRNMPLFWVKVEDVAPYLSQHMIMTSNYNNAATCSMADFFDTNMYKGTIYMTTNMQNKILQEQYANPKDLKKEQDRIEKQLSDFEKNIWENPVDSAKIAERDSLASLQKKAKKVKVSKAPKENTEVKKTAKAEKTKSASSSSPSTPRVSVRRQRH
ncbi:MAG: gliding motility protein GldN [Bacteroidaceae bacterium]|nr:gliding motility protein GldN [Bacteroidaceae bacterium]